MKGVSPRIVFTLSSPLLCGAKSFASASFILRAAFIFILCALSACTTAPVNTGSVDSKTGRSILKEINVIWRYADCRIRIPVEIKKGVNSEGWSQSPWMCKYGNHSNDEFCFKFRVSDRNAVLSKIDGKSIRPGTRFVAEGWSMENPDRFNGLALNLRFSDLPVKAKFTFVKRGRFTGVGSSEVIRNIEHYMRFAALEVIPQDESIEVTPVVRKRKSEQRLLPLETTGQLELDILAVSVNPIRAYPGEEVRMVITYSVEGVPLGANVKANEMRTIRYKGQTLASFNASVDRVNGVHQSTQPLRIPRGLSPGIFELLAKVDIGGIAKQSTTVFEVIDDVR